MASIILLNFNDFSNFLTFIELSFFIFSILMQNTCLKTIGVDTL